MNTFKPGDQVQCIVTDLDSNSDRALGSVAPIELNEICTVQSVTPQYISVTKYARLHPCFRIEFFKPYNRFVEEVKLANDL